MIRFASKEMDAWLRSRNRKPAILRGARQVGKTWLVRELAKRHGRDLIELNFERFPDMGDLFAENDPREILDNIAARLSIHINPETAILFLDEIQAAPELFSKLRWFKEEMPEMPVIAAGSLLEFAVETVRRSMPVGRVTYYHLAPMSFFEFLLATGEEALYRKLLSFELGKSIPPSLNEKCLKLYRDYCLIGGMPEVVRDWTENHDLASCIKLQQDLLATYRDDFFKYGGAADARLLAKLMLAVAEQLGNKFIYSRVDPSLKTEPVKKALTLLMQARVCTRVSHTAANGLPLGAQSNEKFFKTIFLDIGLITVQLGLSAMGASEAASLVFSNKGGLAEQFVGQQLHSAGTPGADPNLFYWQNIGGRAGKIDYIVQHGNRIIPVEIKSGAAGSIKSLHQFMADKKPDLAVRFNTNLPMVEDIRVKTTTGTPVAYRLVSLPVYLAERLSSILRDV